MIVLSIANQKGGVGKTTTAVNLGAELARAGQNVVVLDLDSQANATQALGVDPLKVTWSTHHLLTDKTVDIKQILVPTDYGVQLVPSNMDVAVSEREVDKAVNREQVLKRRLDQMPADVDFVLIDCPPSLTLLTLNALAASKYVLVPLQTEPFAVSGLSALLDTVQLVQEELNPDLKVLGILFTLYDRDHAMARNVMAGVQEAFSKYTFQTIIPRYGRLSEAAIAGPIRTYAPNHPATALFESLTQEVLERVHTT